MRGHHYSHNPHVRESEVHTHQPAVGALDLAGVVRRMDWAVAWVLRVQPLLPGDAVSTTSSQPFEMTLLVSAVRCTLRYVGLPFLLPILGITTGAALGLLLILDVIAVIAIVATLRRLWQLRHPRRWQYLLVALVFAVAISFFFVNDIRTLPL